MGPITNPAELRTRALEVLFRELGFVNAMRFLLQVESGRPGADYVKERNAIFPPMSDADFLNHAGRFAAPHKPS